MKKLITIILAIIMTLITAPQKGADQLPVTAVKTPQAAITISVEKVPEASETTAKKAFVSKVEEPETQAKIKETTVIESEDVTEEPEVFNEEKTPAAQETATEEWIESTEEIFVTEPKKETVECIDHGDQSLVKYKPQIGGQLNPFENDTPTKIDDRPVEDYIGEGEDRPGEGKHF